jgi:phosphomethylpyrimidine synthase
VSAQEQEIGRVQEIAEGLTTPDQLRQALLSGSAVLLRGRERTVALGGPAIVKVNVNVGVSDPHAVKMEFEKVSALSHIGYRPDAMMDLSIVPVPTPVYRFIIDEFGGPVGTLPHYLCYKPSKGIDVPQLLEEIHKQAEAGVSWMTLHLAVRKDLYEEARRTRLTPVTARGGGIVADDMYINRRTEGVLSLHFDKIAQILRKHRVVLSVGATFRPSNVIDALDEVHRKETELQGQYITEARRLGVAVIMEGVGHIRLDQLQEYVEISKARYKVPFVPLGPIPTDAAVGEDHIASAIGAAYMASVGGADMINSVTREEHTGKVPSQESIIEGLKAARIAAHAVNICRYPRLHGADRQISRSRAANYTCVVEGGIFTESAKARFSMGCTRCGNECPLVVNWKIDQKPQR